MSVEEALLLRLLEAWRGTFAIELEEPIARVGEAVARSRGPIAKGKLLSERTWHAVAAKRDPGDVDRLLDASWPAGTEAATLRIRALAKFPIDPRISTKLAKVATRYRSRAGQVHAQVSAILARAPTSGMLPAIDELRGQHTIERDQYIVALEACSVVPRDPAPPALLAEARTIGKPSASLAELLEQHARNPGDLGLRPVLADALIDAGDPRGELITVQTAIAEGRGDAKTRARAAELIAAHADAWTRGLPSIVPSSRRFERGFLVSARLGFLYGEALERSLDRPEWLTLEELTIDDFIIDISPLVSRLPLLRTLVAYDAVLRLLEQLGTWPTLRALGIAETWTPRDRTKFPNLEVFAGAWIEEWVLERFRQVQRDAVRLGVHAIVHLAFPVEFLNGALPERRKGPPITRFAISRARENTFDAPGWRLEVPRIGSECKIAWRRGSVAERGLIVAIVQSLVAARFSDIAIHVEGKFPRDAVEEELAALIKQYARTTAIHFDGAPVDLSSGLSAADRTKT